MTPLDLEAIKERVDGQRSSHPGIENIRNDALALIAEVERLRPMEEALKEVAELGALQGTKLAYAVAVARAALSPDTKEEA